MQIGDRIQIDEETRGTVRYKGKLNEREGEWVGVEWDDVTRGIHNGQVDGIQYFKTEKNQNSATFIKENKILPVFSMVDMIKSKYAGLNLNSEEENSQYNGFGLNNEYDEEMYIPSVSNKTAKKVELMGKGKLEKRYKKTHLLKIISLCFECINEEGLREEITKLLPNLTELDLSCSLITDWNIVRCIISDLPKLELLNFSVNRFNITKNKIITMENINLSRLKSLFLVDCKLTWEQILDIVSEFKSLKQLKVCGNEIDNLNCNSDLDELSILQNIELLDLSTNNLSSWSEIEKFKNLKNLITLNLCNTKIKNINYPKTTINTTNLNNNTFQNLSSLLIGECCINDWDSINNLNKFPNLTKIRLSGNPLFSSIFGGGRYEIIGRIEKIIHLNGASVSQKERIDCEKRYLSRIAQSVAQDNLNELEISKHHPRYNELIEKHGIILANSTTTSSGTSMKSNVVEVELICNAVAGGAKMSKLKKKLPLSMTLGSLKQLLEKLFNVHRDKIHLHMKADVSMMPEDITDASENEKLSDLYFKDGQEVYISDKLSKKIIS